MFMIVAGMPAEMFTNLRTSNITSELKLGVAVSENPPANLKEIIPEY